MAADVYLRSRHASVPLIPPSVHSDDEVRQWTRDVLFPSHEIWLATTAQGDAIAVLALGEEWVDQLYVDPDYLGRGIGTRLIALAKKLRPNGLQLWAFQSNSRALGFYEHQGFVVEERTDGNGNEERAPDVRFGWRPEIDAERRADGEALAERAGARLFDLEVVDSTELSPAMRRITLSAPELADMTYDPGQDLMLAVALAGRRVVRRRYTIRALDRATSTVTIDMVLHGDGPGARWAARASAGDRLEGIGPRGKVTLEKDVDWHLFVGDASYLAAAASMAEAVPSGQSAISIIQVDPEDVGVLEPPGAGAIEWVGSPEALKAAASTVELPAGRGHAYLGGEFHAVNEVRELLAERGLARDQISPKPYWRAGRSNQDHGEPEKAG